MTRTANAQISATTLPGYSTTPADVDMQIYELELAHGLQTQLMDGATARLDRLTGLDGHLLLSVLLDARDGLVQVTANKTLVGALTAAGFLHPTDDVAAYEVNARAQQLVDDFRTAEEQANDLARQLRPLYNLYEANLWVRWYLVQNTGGHLHDNLNNHCGTCFETTQYGWVPQASGATHEEIVEAYGMRVCSVCVPGAPAMPAYKTSGRVAVEQAEAEGFCVGGERVTTYRNHGDRWGTCSCGARGLNINQDGTLRKHKSIALENKARLTDPDAIHAEDGSPLQVEDSSDHRQTFTKRVSAERAYVEAMAYSQIPWSRRNAAGYVAYAQRLAAPLAAKAGMEVADWEATMVKRIAAKVKRDS